MANRVLKPSICTSDDINRLSFFEEVIFYRMIVSADDKGYLDGRPEILKAVLFPLKKDITLTAIRKALANMTTVGLIEYSEEGGRPRLKLSKWECHQRIRSNSDNPIGEEERDSAALRGATRRNAAQKEKETKKESFPPAPPLKEIKKEKENINGSLSKGACAYTREEFTSPTLEEVKAYVVDQKLTVDAQLWHSFYSSNGWTVGGSPMRDWKGSLLSWHLRGVSKPEKSQKKPEAVGGITESTFDGEEFMRLAMQRSLQRGER
jgi:hypothetical protein